MIARSPLEILLQLLNVSDIYLEVFVSFELHLYLYDILRIPNLPIVDSLKLPLELVQLLAQLLAL